MTGKWELCRVAETYEREHEGPLVKLFIAGSAIESTYHHPYWVVEGENLADRPEPDHVRAATVRDAVVPGRWVDAGDLCIGDVLLLQDGRREPITEILLRQATCRVYNLAVEGLRNYAVGPVSVLAHNMCAAAAKNVPNPDGKLGSPAHRARVGEVVSDIESRKLIAHTEFRVKTVNGQKATRFIDVVAIDPNTMRVVEVHQVGRTLKSNPLVPVARERAAFRDVRQSLELRDAVRIFHDFI